MLHGLGVSLLRDNDARHAGGAAPFDPVGVAPAADRLDDLDALQAPVARGVDKVLERGAAAGEEDGDAEGRSCHGSDRLAQVRIKQQGRTVAAERSGATRGYFRPSNARITAASRADRSG